MSEEPPLQAEEGDYHLLVPQDPSRATTVRLDWGDGSPSVTRPVPAGDGYAQIGPVHHVFPSSYVGYVHRATIVETGTYWETTTLHNPEENTSPSGNGPSSNPSVSGDGQRVAFQSSASDLVAADANGKADVFVRDRNTQQTVRASVGSSGAEGNGDSTSAAISADGRFVAFSSMASNLVSGDSNGLSDVFLRDMQTGTTARVSDRLTGCREFGAGCRVGRSG